MRDKFMERLDGGEGSKLIDECGALE